MAERIKGLQIDLSMKDMGVGATLAGVRRSFKTLNSDLKLSKNNFKNSEKSMTSYKNRIRELYGATKQQRNNVKELRKQYQQTTKEQGANSAKAARLRTEYNKQADTLNYLEKELDNTVDGFKKFQKESQAAARVSNSSFGRLGKTFTDMGPKLKNVGDSMKSVGRSISMRVTAPIAAGFGLAAKKSVDFDDSMRKVKATSGATGGEFRQLSDKALEMGAKTKFSASESADALNFMALAGWDSKEMMSGISGVMDLAAASGEDLGQVSDIVTDYLTAFGMKAEDSGKFADVLAQTSSKANTNVTGLGEAFKYAAPVAGALGYSVEDTSIAIGLMSNAGIKGEKAGTALRTMFTNLAKPTKAMKDKMDELGISITDSNGEMLPMRDVVDQLRGKMSGLSKDQQAAAAATIFGKESMSGALAVVNASEEDYNKLTKSIDGSKGASKRMSKEMESGIGGSFRKMKSAVESLAISIGDVLAPFLRKAADAIASLATKFANMPSWLQGTIVAFGTLAAAIGPIVLVTGMFTAALGSVMTTLGPLIVGITKAGGIMKYFSGVASGVAKVSPLLGTALRGIGSAATFMLGPWGLVIAGVAALGAGLVIAYKKSETFRNIVNGALQSVITGFKLLWNGIKTVLTPVGNAIASFGRQLAKTFGQFWAENGPQFMEALNNIKTGFMAVWNFIKPLISGIGSLFKTVFGGILSFIQFIMSGIQAIFKVGWTVIKALVVSTWNNIKEVITGALDVIMGTVKIFIGLFTGDFSKMWEGVKQLFSGAVKFIWNLIQLWFVGKIFGVFKLGLGLIKGVVTKSLGSVKATFSGILSSIWGIVKKIFGWISKFMRNIFSSIWKFTKAVWSNIKLAITNPVALIRKIIPRTFKTMSNIIITIFSGLKKAVSVIFRTMKTVVVNIAKALSNLLKGNFSGMRKNLQNITKALKNAIVKLWRILKNTVVSVAKQLWSGIKGIFKSLFNTAKNITQNLRNSVVNKWKNLKKSVVDLAKGAKDGVVKGFKAMYNKGVEWLDKLKGFIKNAKNGFKKVATNLGKSVANGAIAGLNKMIDGINTLSDKIMNKKIIKKKIPKLSTGTGANPGVSTDSQGRLTKSTKAIVNDKGIGNASGSNGHKELIHRRNGKIEQLKGNNKRVSLKRGDAVYNGAQSKSILPHLSTGTLLKDSKKRKKDEAPTGDMYVPKNSGNAGGNVITDAWDWTKDKAKKAKDGFSKAIGDIWDYAKNPGKLINKVLKHFGVDFSSIKGAMGGTMEFGYNGLKKGLKELVTGWFDGSGDGDSGYLDLSRGINFGFARTPSEALAQGYPFARAHHGIDLNYPYGTKVRSTTSGTATGSKGYNGGFGNMMSVKSGIMEVIYGHLSKLNFMGPKKVKPGDELGLSGGDPDRQGPGAGSSTGPHLHYEMRWNGVAKDPMDWLKKNNGGGKSKKASAWSGDIKKAAKRMGVTLRGNDLNNIISLINAESSGNAGTVQSGVDDVNSRNGNPAQGLLQYIPQTFRNYAMKGHTNIKSGYDQLLAFFNNKSWRSKFNPNGGWSPTGARKYAKGTNNARRGFNQVFEEGGEIINMRGGEQVIPNDVSVAAIERVVNSDIYGKTQSAVAHVIKQYADQIRSKENDETSKGYVTPSNDAKYYKQMIERQDKTISKLEQSVELLTKIVASTTNIEQQPKGFNERDISKVQGKRAQMMAYNMGGNV
ncbi:phage tail tape measure protein [Staphylococcus xylosus]|uniref:phage tail tape measure protein n=1 Tax=Staphylococcus xylosus TaxID=1288 RepID=UPI001CDBBB01|nr:phage tail tape measure protein [Staphylococcus xylosus]MCQ3819234.1 phage tail tape measure protein [Staphylococcus xylosus]UBV36661.1 phage tail tape measure protein [Staphylococcus xylosus]